MGRFLLGVALATLALYGWGMLYWGFNPLPYTVWQRTPDDAAAGQALREHFPADGTYYLPGLYNDPATLARLHESGPVAFVHITAALGRPQNDTRVLVAGFLLDLFVVVLLALLLRRASLHHHGARVVLVLLAGSAAVVLIDAGDAVWWYLPWPWKMQQAVYDWSAFAVAGLVLAAFVRPADRRVAG